MERGRHGRQRCSVALTLSFILTAALLAACTPQRNDSREAGWSLTGNIIPSDRALAIPEDTDAISLVLELPAGYELAEGFNQQGNLVTPDGTSTFDLAPVGSVTRVVLPDQSEINLTLLIGFCSISAKQICYIDRAELPLSRSSAGDQRAEVALTYVPEEPM